MANTVVFFKDSRRKQASPASNKSKSLTRPSPYSIYLSSLAPSGRKAMAVLLNQCAVLFGHQGIAEHYAWHTLDFEKVHNVRSIMIDADYAASTINMTLAALRGVAKAAFNLKQMDADDVMRINAVKPVKGNAARTGRRLSENEIQQLLSGCKALVYPTTKARAKAMLLVGLGAGLRCSEICSLDATDLDMAQGLLSIKKGKGRKYRRIFLAQEIITALKKWLGYRGMNDGPLFSRLLKNGKMTDNRLSTSGLTHALKELQVVSGVINFTPHDLRRTFITRLIEKNVDLNTVRQLAGHSDVNTTIKYDKRDVQWQKGASQGIRF